MTRPLPLPILLLICCVWSASGWAETIDFEDPAADGTPVLLAAGEYSHLGVSLETDDGVVLGPEVAADWQLSGNEGPSFLGFDGSSGETGYTLSADFDPPVVDFELDVAAGDSDFVEFGFDRFVLAGYLDGQFVDSVTVPLDVVGEWQTVPLVGEVNQVFAIGAGFPGMRFGIDRLHWLGTEEPVEEPLEVVCDIKPGNDANVLNPASRGVVPVVLYGAEGFDVLEVDPESLAFGPGESPLAHRDGPHPIDLDRDGHLDLLLHHRVADSGLEPGDAEACLFGATWDGAEFVACEDVKLVPKR